MTDAEIEKKVIELVAQNLNQEADAITKDSSFTNDLNADSLDIVELLMAFEEEFGTKIPEEQAEKIHTVVQETDFIKSAMHAKAGG